MSIRTETSAKEQMNSHTAVHTLTNGHQNFIFEVGPRSATIKTINAFGGLEHEEERTLGQARYQWRMALKHGCTKGWTVSEYREQPSAFDEEPLCVD